VPATPEGIGTVRRAMAEFAAAAGAGTATLAEVRLAVSEAVTNAVRHAYGDGARPGEIRATARVQGSGAARRLVLTISDDGPGVRPRTDSPGLGLGLPLISQMTDSVDIVNDEPGATIRMGFRLP
jgi:anti-sigma regulatory factor (Ser/Thr protein kinase)